MHEAVSEFTEAVKRREEAVASVEKIVRVVHAAADALEDWRDLIIANLPESKFPAAVMQNPQAGKINAREWPSILGIYDALNRFHQAEARVQSTWQAVPADERTGLTPP